jgi:hypothetical protein
MSERTKRVGKTDWTKLESYAKLSWDQAEETLRTCGHMLAFGDDAWAIDVVKTVIDSGGEAGMAALVSALFLKKHGANKTAMTAVHIYRDIAKNRKDWGLGGRVDNLEYMVYFADHSGGKKLDWPMAWPFEDDDRRAGLANVMLGMAMPQLAEGTTSEAVAAMGIQRFLFESHKKFVKRMKEQRAVAV